MNPIAVRRDLSASVNVVIVEDDSAVRPIIAEWISESGAFTLVGQFGDAESAMETITRRRPDIVLMDINLPGLSGVECVRKLKPGLPQTQFVMLTIYEDTHHIFQALSSGATGYLSKTTPREKLLAALREVHEGGSPMSSQIARKVVQSFRAEPLPAHPTDELSKREIEVLSLLAQGHTYKDIADSIGIGFATVSTYARRIYEKLQVNSRGQAVAIYANISSQKKI